jgi:hypothetical protein
MNIQLKQITDRVETQNGAICQLVDRALASCAKHHRAATVTLTFTDKRDKKAQGVVVLEAQIKTKEPKSDKSDLSGKSDKEELGRWQADDATADRWGELKHGLHH